MKRLIMIILFVVQSLWGICQKQNKYYDSAIDKIKNKSWEHEKFCINDTYYISEQKQYKYYFEIKDLSDVFLTTNYKIGLKYCSICQTPYEVDTISYEVKEAVISDLPCFIFIDSNANKKGIYIVATVGEGSDVGELSFLSDSEFVFTYQNSEKNVKSYYKRYKTPNKFYELYNITPH